MLLSLCIVSFCLVEAIHGQYLVEILEVKNGSNANETQRRPIVRCDATGASFGEDVMTFSFGLQTVGCALPTRPQNACSNIIMPEYNRTLCSINFAVVPRGNCSFAEKAYYAQGATPTGYQAIIIYNDPHQAPIPMAGEHKYADKVQIPVVMVTYSCMENLLKKFSADKGYLVTITATGYYDLIKYLVPFVAIVGFCFIVLFISLVIRLCRERRRMARKRLSRSNLKKIPTRKYKKGDAEETCAICLEDFAEADKLRILPCKHAYHCKCIDPWLTKSRKVCPVCKRKVGPSRGSDSSDSDSERPTTSTYTTTVTRESDRLLRNAQPMGMSGDSGAEFAVQGTSTSSQGENPSLSPAQRDDETSDGGSVLMRASSFLNLHSPYPSLSQQPSTSGSLPGGRLGSANEDVGVGRRMKSRLAKMRSQLSDMLQRGEQRLRGVGGAAGSGSNTLLVDNVDYGDTEPDYAGSTHHDLPSATLPIDASPLPLETRVDIESAGGLRLEEERPTTP